MRESQQGIKNDFEEIFQLTNINIKVKVHKMFKILSILDNFKIKQLGDVMEWFFRGYLKVGFRFASHKVLFLRRSGG